MRTITQKDLETLNKDGKVDRKSYKKARAKPAPKKPVKPDPIDALTTAQIKQMEILGAVIEHTKALDKMVLQLAKRGEVVVKSPEKNKKWHVGVTRGKDKLITAMDVEVTG